MIDPLIQKMMQYVFRKKVQVNFNDLERTKPISTVFGFDRGTPIDRRYIDQFLMKHAQHITGRVLEVGDSACSRKFGGGKVTSFEVLHAVPGNKAATIVGDLTNPETLPENFADCFICTQTFNFIFDVPKAIAGAYHLLKPSGVLLATVAGLAQISHYDMERWGDYWRFTSLSIEKLFEPLFRGKYQIETYGNVLAATAFLQGVAVEDLPDESLLDEVDPSYQLLIAICARKDS